MMAAVSIDEIEPSITDDTVASNATAKPRVRGTGGIVEVRPGVHRIDFEAPPDPVTGKRRRRSRQIPGTLGDAERALELLQREFSAEAPELEPDAAHPDLSLSESERERAPRSSSKKAPSARKTERSRRTHGSGGLFQVGPELFRISTEAPRNPETGRRRRVHRFVEGTRDEAELALAKLKVTTAGQRQVVPRAAQRSFRSIFDLYLGEAKNGRIELGKKTLVTSRSAANTMCKQRLPEGELFGELRPDAASWEDIEDLYAAMKQSGLGVDWIRRCATVLNRTLEYAKKRSIIDSNPCAEAHRPRSVRTKPYSPSHEDVAELMEAAASCEIEGRKDEELLRALEIFRGTGLRKGELLALFVGDLDFKKDEFNVSFAIEDGGPGVGIVREATKKSDWRDVPMKPSVRKAFEEQLEYRQRLTGQPPRRGEYVFAKNLDGTEPIRPDDLSDRLAIARGKSALTFLDLRHYVATTLLDAGVPYRTVADLLGNSEVTLRLHYDGRTDTGKRNAIDALDQIEAS